MSIIVGGGVIAAVSGGLSNLLAARLQMAFTLGFHIVLACLGVGLPLLMLVAERRFLRTGDEQWRTLARRWSKAFAVLFAVGAVTGTVLSFELGVLWPEFMGTFGAVIGFPFTLEGFAFFLEAIFVGIYIYGWDRLSPRIHWWTGVPIAVAGFASAFFVVTVNAWMNTPQGFRLVDGVVVDVDPIRAMFNPATGAQTAHMILAAYMVSGFLVASIYAVIRLRGGNTVYCRRAMTLGLVLGCICAPLEAFVGHRAAQMVAETQPVKFAAMEGQFRTEAGAPLRIGGIPDESARVTRYALEVPKALSWFAYGDTDAVVRGLNEYAPEDTPPVAIVHLAFQAMVGVGTGLVLVTLLVGYFALRRRRIPDSRVFLWVVAACGPLTVLALEAGWVVTEVGRQPWIVQGVMRTADAVTEAPGIGWVLGVTVVIYTTLLVGLVAVLRLLARLPIREVEHGS